VYFWQKATALGQAMPNFQRSGKFSKSVAVLKGLKADEADHQDCITEWTELTDLGGLFHATQPVYQLLECRVRQHLNSTTVHMDQHHQAALFMAE